MRRLSIHIALFTLPILFLRVQSIGQARNTDNFIKIVKSYVDFRVNNSKGSWNKNKDVLVIGAKAVDKNSLWFEVAFTNTFLMSNLKYTKVYQVDSFKLAISEDLDMSYVLIPLFKEIPYENLNLAKIKVDADPSPWHVTLDKNYEIISVESKYRFKEVVQILKKYKVKFSNNFHFIQNLPSQAANL